MDLTMVIFHSQRDLVSQSIEYAEDVSSTWESNAYIQVHHSYQDSRRWTQIFMDPTMVIFHSQRDLVSQSIEYAEDVSSTWESNDYIQAHDSYQGLAPAYRPSRPIEEHQRHHAPEIELEYILEYSKQWYTLNIFLCQDTCNNK